MMRLFILSLNRAGVEIEKNKAGVLKVYFSPATSIGVESVCEFVEIDTSLPAHKLAELLKTYLPDGIKIISEYDTEKRINISKIAVLAKYEVDINIEEGYSKKITEILRSDEFKINLKMNNEAKSSTVKELVHNFYFEKGKLFIIAGVGEDNLNIVQTIHQIGKLLKVSNLDAKIKKTNIFLPDLHLFSCGH